MSIPFITPAIKFAVAMVTFAERMDKQEKKMNEIEHNYLSRFDDVKDRIAASEKNILKEIAKNHVNVIDRINNSKK